MKNEIKKGAMLSYVLVILTNVIALIYTPFLIRCLGQSEYGLYSLITSIIGYLTVLDFGFGNAVVIYTAKYRAQNKLDEEQKLHGMFFVIFFIIGLLATVLGLILFFNVNAMFGASMTPYELNKAKILLLLLTFNLAITFPFSIYNSIITAYEKFTFQKVLAIIRTIANPIIMLPLLLLGYKSVSLVIVTTILNMIIFVSNYLYCKNKLKIKIKYTGIDKKQLTEIFAYSFFIFLNAIIDKINWSLDNFILGSVSGTIAVSVYTIGAQINTMFINFSTAINGVLVPKITKMITKGVSNKEITNEFVKIGRIQFIMLFLLLSGFIIFGCEFILLWAGENYASSYYIALILLIPVIIPLTQNVGITVLQARNLHRFRSLVLAGIAILNVVLSIPLAKLYGGIGSAIGTSLAIIIGNIIIINIYYYKKININVIEYWKNIGAIILKDIIPVSIIIVLLYFTNLRPLYNLMVFIPIYTIIYFVFNYHFIFNIYEKDTVNSIFKKVGTLWKK